MLLVHDSDGKIIYDLSDYNIIIHEDGTDGLTKERYEKGKFTYLNLVHKDDDPVSAPRAPPCTISHGIPFSSYIFFI